MNTTEKLLKSAAFSASAKIISKLIGFVSTLILARVLTPDDFGLIAVISIVMYLFDVLANAATEQYAMQKFRMESSELHTAWTFNLLLKGSVCLALILSADWVSELLNRPEIVDGLYVVAFVLPLQALKSPSVLQQKRLLRYSGIFWLALAEKLTAFVVVISMALLLKSYWAFILADVVSVLVGVGLSYSWFRKRPRFTLQSLGNQWRFSSWMLFKNLVGYVRSQIDTVFVTRHFSSASTGQYHVARELAMMPGHYLLAPAIEPLISAFRKDKNQLAVLVENVSFCLLIAMLLAMPVAGYLTVFSEEIVTILLGEQWQAAPVLLKVLSWLVVYWSVLHVVEVALVATARVKLLFAFDLLALTSIAGGLLVLSWGDIELIDVAVVRVGIGCITTLLLTIFFYRLHLRQLLMLSLGFAVVAGMTYSSLYVAGLFTNLIVGAFDHSLTMAILRCLVSGGVLVACYVLWLLLMKRCLPNRGHQKRLSKLIASVVPQFR